MHNRESCPWQAAYMCAVLETDPSEVLNRICEALIAIEVRLGRPIEINGVEHKAIQSAQKGLVTLQAERVPSTDIAVPLLWDKVNLN